MKNDLGFIRCLKVAVCIWVISLTNAYGQVQPDTIKADTSSRQLSEVKIKTARSLVRQEIDKLSYDVQGDPERHALNALEIMGKVPMLSIDAGGNITLRGNSSYRILINGKESGRMAANPKEALRNMPAASIKSIEVITSPSSKYDAEGPGGLINIVLVSRSSQGYNGNLRLAHELPTGGPSAGGNFTIRSGKLTAAINGNGAIGRDPQTSEFFIRTGGGGSPVVLNNRGHRRSNSRDAFGGLELSYNPDTLNLITAEYSPYRGYNKVFNYREFDLDVAGSAASRYVTNAENKYSWTGKTLGLNYQRSFLRHPKQLFTLSYRFVSNDNPQVNEVNVDALENYTLLPFIQHSSSDYKEHIMQADLVLPFKHLTFEAGLKTILRYNSSDFELATLDASSGAFANDPLLSNHFENQSKVYGAYNSYQFQAGQLAVKAGYRLEYTTLSGKFRSGMDVPKSDYLNLIPAISILYRINPQSSVLFGYTNRIERPRIYQLDPFADRSMPNYLSYGNPGLRPALAHNMEVNYRSGDKWSVNANLSYSFSDNIIQQVSRYEPESNSAVETYENTGTDRRLKLYLDAGGPLGEKLNLSVNALLARGWFSGQVAGLLIWRSGYNSHLGLNATQKLISSWNLSGSLNYAGQETRLQDITNGQLYNTFRFYGDLVKNKLSASLSLNNPFIRYRYYERSVSGVDFREHYRGQSYARSFGFSISWQLGSLEGGVKKNERRISVDDGKS